MNKQNNNENNRYYISTFLHNSCTNAQKTNNSRIAVGAEQTSEYFPILKNKKIAVFSNHTGMIGNKHTIDVLLENKLNVVAIFSPSMASEETQMPESMFPVR